VIVCVCVCVFVYVCVCVCVWVCVCVRVYKAFFIYVISFDLIHIERKGSPSIFGVLIEVWF